MTEYEWEHFNKERWDEMPVALRDRAVAELRNRLPEEDKKWLRNRIRMFGNKWWLEDVWHFRGGMVIRNLLRTYADILDTQLPSGNWDDYYIPVLEAALAPPEAPGISYSDWDQW